MSSVFFSIQVVGFANIIYLYIHIQFQFCSIDYILYHLHYILNPLYPIFIAYRLKI